ncbi:hypothetical protein [Sulfuricaulis sp.]|jgi:hypothetical protein|uniref:hypothetical protein n=1 Tax=Sulfuricaulis sp. TaxID=2003553 RepID=UPI00355A0BA2
MKDIIQTVQSLVPFLQPYPLWVKMVLSIWFLVTAVMAVGLLFFREPAQSDVAVVSNVALRPESPISKNEAESLPNQVNHSGLSLEEYFSTLDRLKERFLEKEEFVQQLQRTRVTWIGYVDSVKGAPGKQLSINLAVKPDSPRTCFVWFAEEFRTKLFSLRKGDKVIISGIYDTGTPSIPDIQADSIRLSE